MTALDNWITTNNFYKSSEQAPVATHRLFNGGSYYIPKNKEYTFLTMYSNELKAGNPQYVVEIRPRIFKYMIDLDISDDHYWTIEEIINLVKYIQNIVRCFFNDDHSTICCISSAKYKNGKVNTGIHLIWNDIFVASETAMVIRLGILHKIKESNIKILKPWEDIIDELIYTRVGYRMVGSDKMADGIAENRPLKLAFVMNFNGELRENHFNRLNNDVKALIMETSIRYVSDACKSTGATIKHPDWLDHSQINLKIPECSFSFSVCSSKEHRMMEIFIREKLPKAFNRCKIKSIKRMSPDSKYKCGRLYIETNSKYCLNIGREHNSCGIYFFATESGLWQRCFCACNKLDNRKKGYCKDFISERFEFDNELRKILFPGCTIEKFKFTQEDIIYSDKNISSLDQKINDKLFDDIVNKSEKITKKKEKPRVSKDKFMEMCGY